MRAVSRGMIVGLQSSGSWELQRPSHGRHYSQGGLRLVDDLIGAVPLTVDDVAWSSMMLLADIPARA